MPAALNPAISRRTFTAMNTQVQAVCMDVTSGSVLAEVERSFAAFEARFSRFRPGSELCRLNESQGDFSASDEMLSLLAIGKDMHKRTAGVFDPSILGDLERSGYDRSFELVERDGASDDPSRAPRVGFARLDADRASRSVRKPPGMRIDLGGIGKGYAVDQASRVLARAGAHLIDAGGDIAAHGDGPDGDGWLVAIADPFAPDTKDTSVVRLRDQCVATSTTLRRRWRRDGVEMHHIIDPRTGAPAVTDIAAASVVAPSATEADVFAKCGVILGAREGMEFIITQRLEALFVLCDGSCVVTDGWPTSEPATQAISRGLEVET